MGKAQRCTDFPGASQRAFGNFWRATLPDNWVKETCNTPKTMAMITDVAMTPTTCMIFRPNHVHTRRLCTK